MPFAASPAAVAAAVLRPTVRGLLQLQEEAGIDPAWLGRELGAQPAEEGSTFRVFHAQLAQADERLKVR